MQACRFAFTGKPHWLAGSALILLLATGCASSAAKRPAPTGDDDSEEIGEGKLRLPKQLAAKHKAAKAAPQSFAPVYAYARAVADACLASLIDKSCESCESAQPRYKRRSELTPQAWPMIEDALSALDGITLLPPKGSADMDQLTATKGRLLWLAGRSNEELSLIDGYALTHPAAVAVVRRRLELLREAGDDSEIQSQCTRSRLRVKSAPEATQVELLAACVALHPGNSSGRSDLVDFAAYLPNLSTAEDILYRKSLVERCEEKVGDENARCAQACACVDKESGKPPAAKCKRACDGCRGETAQQLAVCKKLGELAPQPAPATATRRKSTRPKTGAPAPAKRAPAAKAKKGGGDSGLAPQQAEL